MRPRLIESGLHLPTQLFLVDVYPELREPFTDLSKEGMISLRQFDDIQRIKSALGTSSGKMIVSITLHTVADSQLMDLADRIVELNACQHIHIQLIVLLLEARKLEVIDALESRGVR